MHPLDLIEDHFGGPVAAIGFGLSAINLATLGGQLAGLTAWLNIDLSPDSVEATRADLPAPEGFVLPGSLFYRKTKELDDSFRLSLVKTYLSLLEEQPGLTMEAFLDEIFREPPPVRELVKTYSLSPTPAMSGVAFPLENGYELVVDCCKGDNGPYVDAYVTNDAGKIVHEIPPFPGTDVCRVYEGEFAEGEQRVKFTVDVQSSASQPWDVSAAMAGQETVT